MFQALSKWHAHIPAGEYGGVCISDIDGDGRFVALVANASGANLALKYYNRRLREMVSPAIAAADRPTLGIAAADVDGDGREELHLIGEPGRLLRCGLDGHWTLWAERGDLASGFHVVDGRGTGRYAIVLQHPPQQVEVLVVGPDGALTGLPGMQALKRLEPSVRPPLIVRMDVDGDGELDHFAGFDDAPHLLQIELADEKFRDVATPSLAFPSDLRAAVAADFDNDGFEELLLVNKDEHNRLYRIAGDMPLLELGDAVEGGLGAAAADLDGDGVLELIVSQGASFGAYKSRTATGNAWLRVRPLSRFQAPARGAIVRCSANGRVMVRQIDSGSSGLSLNEPVAHFGLGRKPRVEWVSITWPDGATLTLPDPDVNCTYSVPYPRS